VLEAIELETCPATARPPPPANWEQSSRGRSAIPLLIPQALAEVFFFRIGVGVEEREKRGTSSTNAFASRNKRRLITCNKMTWPCTSATSSTSIIITSART